MKLSIFNIIAIAAMISLAACNGTKFSGDGSSASSKTAGADGLGPDQLANGNDDDDDDGDDLLAQPTVPEFIALVDPVNGDPVLANQVREADECCMSHGQGHGIEVCLTGDKTAVSALSPIKIDGDEVCVPEATILANQALFAAGVMGRCGR